MYRGIESTARHSVAVIGLDVVNCRRELRLTRQAEMEGRITIPLLAALMLGFCTLKGES